MENVYLDTGLSLDAVSVSKCKLSNYRQLVEDGQVLPPLPYDLAITRIRRQDVNTKVINVSADVWQNTYTNREPASYGMLDNPFYSGFIPEQEAILGNTILNKLKGQSAPILMLYRERKETEDMILSFFNTTRKALKVLRHPTTVFSLYRGHPPRTIRDKRFISRMHRILKRTKPTARAGDVWLQYRYAWSTTWMDICDAFTALNKSRQKFDRTYVKASLPLTAWSGLHDIPVGNYRTLLADAEGSFGAHMKVMYRVNDSLMAAAAQIQDPVSFLYDAIPYSFVLDWAVNISGYLDLQTATIGLDFVGGYTSKMSQFTFKYKKGSSWYPGGYHRYECADSAVSVSYSRINFNRSIMTSFPTPTLEFPMKLTTNRVNDLVALVRARMSRSF